MSCCIDNIKIISARFDADMTQEELAISLNLKQPQVSRLESGRLTNPNVCLIVNLSKIFKKPIDFFLKIT